MHWETDLEEFVGDYKGFGIRINVFIREATDHLAVTFNSCEKSTCDLELYNYDAYSFYPLTRDEYLSRGMLDWMHYKDGILYLRRNEAGEMSKMYWMYDLLEPFALFEKVQI